MNGSLLGMVGLLLTSACFSGAEASLFTLAAEGGRNRKVPRVATLLLKDQVGVLTTILLVNLIVNLGFFAATHHWAGPFDSTTGTLIEIGAVLALVVFGEILPKVLAHRFPDVSGKVLLLPVAGFHLLLGPLLRPFGRSWAGHVERQEPLDSSEAADLLEEEHQEVLSRSEMELVRHLLELGELRAGALRRPLASVPQISPNQPLSLALRQMESDGIPWAAVVAEDGEVQGILDRARLPKGAVVRDAMRKVPILPEVAPVANGAQLLSQSGAPFILLVDEYGMSVGIIQRGRWADTLLNRLNLSDDSGRHPIRRVSGGAWEIDAVLPLHDFEDRFGDPGLSDVRVDTIGGLVAEKLERMAKLGDAVVLENEGKRFHLTVAECSETRPLLLHLRVEETHD
ncbi:MAG: CNNM domain-containing protein [Planctomycetota bacterium]|nr:CNNM domain-containing protein [Planctomycetota bacterium]MDA1114625.1 CNNM domain-containing protein [Planctomycetota bacterium]